MNMITVAGKAIETDEYGWLVNRSDWNQEVAKEMAKADNFELTPEHWEIIDFVREYYDKYQCLPQVRLMYKTMSRKAMAIAKKKRAASKTLDLPAKGMKGYLHKLFPRWDEPKEEEAFTLRESSEMDSTSKRRLYELFPQDPRRQAGKYAGLPKPSPGVL